MSEQPTATATRPPGARPKGKTYGGLTRNQWLIVGGVFVAAVGYILWRRHQASAAGTSTSGAASNVGSNECTDQNGNPVDCNEQFAQELAAMQNALDQLGAASGAGSSGGVGSGSTGATGTTGTTDGTTTGTATTTTAPASSTPTTSTGSTTTATAAKTAGPITGLKATPSKTSFKASWNAASNAQGYKWAVRNLATHTDQTNGQTSGTSVTVSGLKSGVDYNFGIQALPGGIGDNIHVRTT